MITKNDNFIITKYINIEKYKYYFKIKLNHFHNILFQNTVR